MTDETAGSAEPDVLDMFDEGPSGAVVCRVCGSLVSEAGEYRRAHWDWHETPNGA